MRPGARLLLAGLLPALAGLPACAALPPWVLARAGRPAPVFESEEFVVTVVQPGDTAETLAARFLEDPGKAWMIEDYNDVTRLVPGREVVVPRRPWNAVGVEPDGYQTVPVLVYHQIGSEARGRVVVSAAAFEAQMRYLKAHGYRVITLAALREFLAGERQLPRRAVALTFDDGYRSFLTYAYPVLKDLGFPATLFVYTDYVGAGRRALGWPDLERLAREGFDIQAHSKTHGDLRRRRGESEADYARRMQAELGEPQALFERHLGRRPRLLAFPYGVEDDELLAKVREFGYEAAFTVQRDGNPVFASRWRLHRSQVYGDMTLDDFARSLAVFTPESLQ